MDSGAACTVELTQTFLLIDLLPVANNRFIYISARIKDKVW